MVRGVLPIGSFFLGLAVVCWTLSRLKPFPDVPQVREKLGFYQAHCDDFDTLFIGSSRIYRQISPQVFDREMDGMGVQVKSFNLGIDAMTSPELFYVFDRAMEARPHQLRHVVVDLNPLRRHLGPSHAPDELRMIYWHDFARTELALRAVLRDPRRPDPQGKSALFQAHTRMMLNNYVNVGDGSVLLGEMQKRRKSVRSTVLGPDQDGFLPIDAQMPGDLADEYDRALAQRKADGRVIRRDPILVAAFREFIEKVETSGARTYFIISPTVTVPVPFEPDELPWVHDHGGRGPIALHFDEPDEYPELFEKRHRFDMEHLNKDGALIYTRLLAERLAGHMRDTDQETNVSAASLAPLFISLPRDESEAN